MPDEGKEAPEAGAEKPQGDTPPPQPDEGAAWRAGLSPEATAELGKRESENKALRDEVRELNARTLAQEHGFSDKPTLVSLLSSLPKDQQADRAKAIATEVEAKPPTEPEPPKEPPEAGDLKVMDEGAPEGTPPKPTQPGDETLESIRKVDPANATAEMRRLQEQGKQTGRVR
jgi:hypothetical protein